MQKYFKDWLPFSIFLKASLILLLRQLVSAMHHFDDSSIVSVCIQDANSTIL